MRFKDKCVNLGLDLLTPPRNFQTHETLRWIFLMKTLTVAFWRETARVQTPR